MADQKPADVPVPAPVEQKPAPIIVPDPNPQPQETEETKQLRQENAEYKFKAELGDVAATYPKAREYSKQIQEKVAKGYSTADAALIVLHENNALQAPVPAAPAPRNGSSGLGGSMDNPPPRDQKDPEPGTPEAIEFYANRFRDLEKKGEIRID